MKTELEKCMEGENYRCHDEIFLEYKKISKTLLTKYNSLHYDHKSEKEKF